VFAQHGGHGQQGGQSGSEKSGSGAGAKEDRADAEAMNSFYRALAIQATPDQVSQFQSVLKNTDAAAKHAQELREALSKAEAADNAGRITALSTAVANARTETDDFIKNFSKTQSSVLKNLVKKLKKADSELANKTKALSQEAENAKSGGSRLSEITDQLQKALEEFRQQQIAIASEMGIKT
jgi:uncharacterized phage infection (PIP) family protein YhgE